MVIHVRMFFFILQRHFEHPSGLIKLLGVPFKNNEEVKDSAAVEGIKYMEITKKIELEDYNYSRLKTNEQHNLYLLEELENKKRKFQEITQNNFTPASHCDIDTDLNRALLEVEETTRSLVHLTVQSDELLQTVGEYPYKEEEENDPDEDVS